MKNKKVNNTCPPGFIRVGNECLPDIKPTQQDSLNVYNRAVELNNFYGKNKDYKFYNEKNFNSSNSANNSSNEPEYYLNDLLNLDLNYALGNFTDTPIDLTNKSSNYLNDVGVIKGNKMYYDNLPLSEYRKPKDSNNPYIIEQRESANKILNLNAPYGYYDARIQPQGFREYMHTNDEEFGDMASIFYYDPVAVKPFEMRTPEEHTEFQKKYGNYNGSKTPLNFTKVPEISAKEYEDIEKNIDDSRLKNSVPLLQEEKYVNNEPDYSDYYRKGYSPEDAEALNKIKGMSFYRGDMNMPLTEKDKLNYYKQGMSGFKPDAINISKGDDKVFPTMEDRMKMNEDPTYLNKWVDLQRTKKFGEDYMKKYPGRFKMGGRVDGKSGIHIKPENKGKFTAWAKSHDMGVQEAANKVMANPDEYSSTVVKRANFAKNAAKWNKGEYGMDVNPLSMLTNKNGAYGLHVEGRYGHVDGRYGHVDGRYGHVDGEKGMQVKYKKGGYLKDEDTYVTEDGKETRRGLWANVHLKNKREGKAEYGIRVINPFLWKEDYDKKHSYNDGGDLDDDGDEYRDELVPVEIENSERVYKKNEDGSYSLMLETDKTAPRHEEGGVKLGLPEDSLVFPKRYFDELDDAMDEGYANGDWSMMDEVADKMLNNAQKAFDEGKPFSSGGDSRDLSKMRCGGCGSKMSMGGKCNRCGGGTKYSFGGALRRLYAGGGAVTGNMGDAMAKAAGGIIDVQNQLNNFTQQKLKDQFEKKENNKESKKFVEDKSLPNWGRAKKEQAMLNELIARDQGEALVLDDIIGDKTLGAMKKYEGKGYKRPELFSDANLALYKKQWDDYVSKSSGGNQKTTVEPTAEDTKTVKSKETVNDETPKTNDDNVQFDSWSDLMFGGFQNLIPKATNENQGSPESFMQTSGYTKVPVANAKVIDGDTVEINKKKYRLSDLQGDKAYFDAAESTMYKDDISFSQFYQNPESPTEYLNTSKKTLQEMIDGNSHIYIKDSGRKDDFGRSIAGMYYGTPENMFHSADSAMVSRGEAIYGQDLEDTRMTERQKNISKKAKYKYDLSPDKARKKIKEMPSQDSWMDAMFPNIAPMTRVKFAQGGAVTKKEDENNPTNNPPKIPLLNPLQFALKYDRDMYNNAPLGESYTESTKSLFETNPELVSRFGVNQAAPITNSSLIPFVNNQKQIEYDLSGMPVVNKGANLKVGGMESFNPLDNANDLSKAQAFLEYNDYAKMLAEKAKAEELAALKQQSEIMAKTKQTAVGTSNATKPTVKNTTDVNAPTSSGDVFAYLNNPENRTLSKGLGLYKDDVKLEYVPHYFLTKKAQDNTYNQRAKDNYTTDRNDLIQQILGDVGISITRGDFETAMIDSIEKRTNIKNAVNRKEAGLTNKNTNEVDRVVTDKRIISPVEYEAYDVAFNLLKELKKRNPKMSNEEVLQLSKETINKEINRFYKDYEVRKKSKDYPKNSNYMSFPQLTTRDKQFENTDTKAWNLGGKTKKTSSWWTGDILNK